MMPGMENQTKQINKSETRLLGKKQQEVESKSKLATWPYTGPY